MLDSNFNQIGQYPLDKDYENLLIYPENSDLSNGLCYLWYPLNNWSTYSAKQEASLTHGAESTIESTKHLLSKPCSTN